ncbi:hypothetical protein C8R47DRAFT_1057095 [Mycena vitilis]|nr:hypothetical protein C8R47DRAFT_1057095 [Mycena vitilis]
MHTGKEDVEFIFGYCPYRIHCTEEHTMSIPDKRLSFHDRHIDERLTLRRVLSLSTLPQTLAGAADEELRVVLDSGLPIPDDAEGNAVSFRKARGNIRFRGSDAVAGSYGVFRHLRETALEFFHPTASLLLMRPLRFISVFMWGNRERHEHRNPLAHGFPFVLDGYALTILRRRDNLTIVEELLHDDDAETQDHLQGVVKHTPVLGTWQIYPPSPEGDEVIKDMDRLTSSTSFMPRLCGTVGFQRSQTRCVPSHDATDVPWTIPHVAKPRPLDVSASLSALRGQPLALRRSARLRDIPTTGKAKSTRTQNPGRVRTEEARIIPAVPLLPTADRSTEDFLQHGWNESVIEDSTFIVFTNGVFERIGIRHRESQTLFLSDLISVSRCDPPYGRIHIGLYITAYRDAVNRYLQIRDAGDIPAAESSRVTRSNAAKRGSPEIHESDTVRGRKRTKVSPQSSIEVRPVFRNEKKHPPRHLHSSNQRLFEEGSTRHLLLVRLQYGIYNSITPSSFLRSGPSLFPVVFPKPPRRSKVSYTPREYLAVTLGPVLSSGATGVIHQAALELNTRDGQVLTENMVVKLALHPDQQERMRHEFSVYRRLAAAKVAGIPKIFGIFDDIEGTASLMIMNHCGRSLAQTHLLEDKTNVHVSAAEKTSFLAVIDAIHKAGVRHRDMRSPNLLLNDAGEAVIIDFDQAELDPPESGLKRELHNLSQLLEGNFTDADSVRTP